MYADKTTGSGDRCNNNRSVVTRHTLSPSSTKNGFVLGFRACTVVLRTVDMLTYLLHIIILYLYELLQLFVNCG